MKRLVWLPLLTWLLLACLCLSACTVEDTTSSEPETSITTTATPIAPTTTATTVDPTTLSIFDPMSYQSAALVKCGCGLGKDGLQHRNAQNDKIGKDAFIAFIWKGDSDATMPDFPSPENSGEDCKRVDCLHGTRETYVDTMTILFCEGVPNLGDYLMYEMTECPAVYIPDSVKSIGEHTFPENTGLVIHCHAGSYAEQYAKAHGMKCEIVEE